MQQDINSQRRGTFFSSWGGGDRGLENERCWRKFVEESRGILPQKYLNLGIGIFNILHGVVLMKTNLVDEL